MKKLILILIYLSTYPCLMAQDTDTHVQGRVVTVADSLPLPGASVTIKGTHTGTITDSEGRFDLAVPEGSVLVISYIGYTPREVAVNAATSLTIALEEDYLTLGEVEVYATGYQELPAERATGSFEHVDNELLNRSTGTDVISRLEGVTNSLFFDKRGADAGSVSRNDSRNLRIRGISTINSEANPLIVVDNFPYEGDINNINPNDIESITILKDAAAASIWGARAGNGVIVITTRKGNFSQKMGINFTSTVTLDQAPDLYYNPNYLRSADFIAVEETLFEQEYYASLESDRNKARLSPVVEILISERDGLITGEEAESQLKLLAQNDIRQDAEQNLFREGLRQQYALNMQGGTDNMRYYLSGGYNKNLPTIERLQSERFTLNASNTVRLMDKLQVSTALAIAQNNSGQNGIGCGSAATQLPYNRLVDEKGNYLPVVNVYRTTFLKETEEEGLLDWQYRPLEELELMNNTTKSGEYRINAALNYQPIKGLDLDLKYQYQKISSENNNLRNKNSYYVRDLVNRFTQDDGEQVFPYGDILGLSHTEQVAHSGRAQIDYSKIYNDLHEVILLAGAEVREVRARGSEFQYYGYDDEVLTFQNQIDYTTRFDVRPRGRAYIPTPSAGLNDYLDRYISYYGNISYTYDNRYTLTGSARRDASNLFGVKTNQKAVPLWSAGAGWNISNEAFWKNSWLSYLKVRATYGYNGNVNKNASAYTTSRYSSRYLTNLQVAQILNPGNPQLRWERVGIFNIGVDFKIFNDRVQGSLEYFNKSGKDLLGSIMMDPTTGFINQGTRSSLINYADTKTTGFDINFQTLIVDRALKWQTDFLISYASTELTDFDHDAEHVPISSFSQNGNLKLREGEPVDGMYALPWIGLNSATGDPVVMIDGQESNDYAAYYNALEFEDLVYIGNGVPPVFGAVRNTVTWKNFSLSANITWKAGYYFRRSSIDYTGLFEQWQGHKDFADRWQKPGDEYSTDVPSMPANADSYRDYVYGYSKVLFEKGDHIRLQDVNISYGFTAGSKLPFTEARIFLYGNNLGILWRANKQQLDPDYPEASVLNGRSLSLGVNLSF